MHFPKGPEADGEGWRDKHSKSCNNFVDDYHAKFPLSNFLKAFQ